MNDHNGPLINRTSRGTDFDACEKPVSSGTELKDLEYYKEYGRGVDEFFEEFTGLEDQSMPAPKPARQPLAGGLLPGEHLDIRLDVNELLANADEWLATPNTNYAGRRPSDLIGTPDEQLLRETLRSVLYSGMA